MGVWRGEGQTRWDHFERLIIARAYFGEQQVRSSRPQRKINPKFNSGLEVATQS
jgi:hypothetical protein